MVRLTDLSWRLAIGLSRSYQVKANAIGEFRKAGRENMKAATARRKYGQLIEDGFCVVEQVL